MQFKTIIQNDIDQLSLEVPYSVKVDSKGDIYILNGYHKLIKFNSLGKPLKSWRTYADTREGGFDNYPLDFAVERNGNVLLLDTHAFKVIIFDNDGTELKQWDLVRTKSGSTRFASRLQLDAEGNIYVLIYRSLIQKYDYNGASLAQWDIAPDATDLAVLPDGRFYVLYYKSLSLFDASGGLVQNWALSDWIEYFAANEEGHLYGIGGGSFHEFREGQFNELFPFPIDISPSSFGSPFALDNQGNFLIADSMITKSVVSVSSTGALVAEYGKGPFDYQLVHPFGIAFSERSVFVSDVYQKTIFVFDKTGKFKVSWGVEGKKPYAFFPQGILYINDTLYVTDGTSNSILKFNEEGEWIGQFGETGEGPGQFNNPEAIACDTEGYLYVADNGNKRIQKFTSDGSYVLQWSTEGLDIEGFSSPSDIAVNIENTVYVLDTAGTVVMFTNEGELIRIAVNSLAVYRPKSIALDRRGNFYIAESYRIKKFEYEGILWAKLGGYGSDESQFNSIGRIALDADGKLYAADLLNKRIQVIDSKDLPEKD